VVGGARVTSVPVVDVSSLSIGKEIGSGGQGRVFELTDKPDMVYKEYHDPGAVNLTALDELIAVPSNGPHELWSRVIQSTAWVLSRVQSHGKVVGVLLRRVPQDYTAVLSGSVKLREVQYLLYPLKPAWAGIGSVTAEQRVEIARAVVELFSDLHQLNVIVGDVSGKNLLWRVSPAPGVLLLDCDALRKTGSHPPTHQLHTPDWDDPHTQAGHATLDSDRYKLSLLIGRILSQDAYIRPGTNELNPVPGVPDPIRSQSGVVFRQAAGAAGKRPNAHQWRDALSARPLIKMPTNSGVRPQPGAGIDPLPDDPEQRPIIPMK
jgi:DNA-binding helix-hairpin-helix protein with protein kinase domain